MLGTKVSNMESTGVCLPCSVGGHITMLLQTQTLPSLCSIYLHASMTGVT